MRPLFDVTPLCIQQLAGIERLLGRYEGLHHPRPAPQLRKSLRVRTVFGSVAIEGNTLTEEQITAVMEGKRVIGPRRDIQEVQNALAAYGRLMECVNLELIHVSHLPGTLPLQETQHR